MSSSSSASYSSSPVEDHDAYSEYVSSLVSGSDSADSAAAGSASASSSETASSSACNVERPEPPTGEVHRSPLLGKDEELLTRPRGYPGVKTTHDAFMLAVKAAPDAPFLGTRGLKETSADPSTYSDNTDSHNVLAVEYGAYAWKSYGEVAELAQAFGSALVKIMTGPVLGLYMPNTEEWVIAQLAAHGMGFAVGGMYDTLGEQALTYCIDMAEMNVVVASAENVPKLLAAADATPTLAYIVYPTNTLGSQKSKLVKKAKRKNIALVSFRQMYENGRKKKLHKWAGKKKLNSKTLNTLCFTSGTTGLPKAVELTHGNIIADLAGGMAAGLDLRDFEEVHLSYLPLPHVFERLIQVGITLKGGAIGFYTGDTRRLLEDVKELRPTIFPSVPRLLNRVYAKIMDGAASASTVKRALFNRAYKTKKKNMESGGCCCCCRGATKPSNTHKLWDKLVFAKARAALGGRVRIIVTGSAPISSDVMAFLRIAFSCTVLEGYGMSESSAAATLTIPGDFSVGHVGIPLPCGEVALAAVPDMGYWPSLDEVPRKLRKKGTYKIGGEICFRGPHVMRGYYKQPNKTAETIDAEGWLHSGDIGAWLETGELKIVDRKKSLFKLSQGEYVSPEKCEGVLGLNPLVAQVFVHGDSTQSFCVAVVVLEALVVVDGSDSSGSGSGSVDLGSLKVRKQVLAAFNEEGRKPGADGRNKLRGFEIPRNVMIAKRPFADDDLLTPTFKPKRNVMAEFFSNEIAAMYAEGDLTK